MSVGGSRLECCSLYQWSAADLAPCCPAAVGDSSAMRNWRRHLITLTILIVLSVLLGPLGLGDWLWSQPRHLLEPPMISVTRGAGNDQQQEMLALNEEVIRLNKAVGDLQERLLSFEQAKEYVDAGVMEIVVYDARVVRRTRGQREQYLEINRGALDGVRRGMAVCAGKSLLGLVVGEQRHSALVRLISDPQSRIAAHIYDKQSRLAGGILAGAEQSGLCEMKYIEDRPGLQIARDQYVVTAGTDGIVPEGLILGVITSAERGNDSDNWRILVQPLRPVHAVTELVVGRQPTAARGH